METSFIHRTDSLIICIGLFIAMLLMVPLGSVAAKLWKYEEKSESKGGVSSLQGALFGLSAFVLAFTFGMSASRFNSARDLIVNEANYIGTAVLRADLYSDSVRTAFRADFKKYVEARISYYKNINDTALFNKARINALSARDALWVRVTQMSKQPNMLIPSNNMITALNNMFDIATTVEMTSYARVPDPIVYMLFILALVTSFIGGFTSPGIRPKDWIIIAMFAALSSMVTYVTLDLSRPMRGIIKGDIGVQAIININNRLN
jgi:hypothetical protein